MGWFLGREKGRWVIVLSLIGNGGNVVLDYLFIRQFGWASAGAGYATALSQYLMATAGLGLIVREGGLGPIHAVLPKVWNPTELKGLFLLNRDILIRTFALIFSFALFTNFSSAMGTQTLAANTLLLQVVTLSAYFIDGIAFARKLCRSVLRQWRTAPIAATAVAWRRHQHCPGAGLFPGVCAVTPYSLWSADRPWRSD